MQGCPLPERTKVYVMPNTSGGNGKFNNNGGQTAWDALGKDMNAAFSVREWPLVPDCY